MLKRFTNQRKLTFISIFLIVVIGIYFWVFHTNYTVHRLPEHRTNLFLVNIQKIKNEYILAYVRNPSAWKIATKEKDSTSTSLLEAGIKIPDIAAFYQMPKDSTWYLQLEIKDAKKWKDYLMKNEFSVRESDFYSKKNIGVFVTDDYCLIALKPKEAFYHKEQMEKLHFSQSQKLDSKALLQNHIAFFSSADTQNINDFFVDLFKHSLLIQSENYTANSSPNLPKPEVLDFYFNKSELDFWNHFYPNTFSDSITKIYGNINTFTASQDTILTYDYDEDFNEVQTQKVQEVYNPEYFIVVESPSPESIRKDWKSKTYINDKEEFVQIPLNKNKVQTKPNSLIIASPQSQESTSESYEYSYIVMGNIKTHEKVLEELPISSSMKNFLFNIENIRFLQNQKEFQLNLETNTSTELLLLLTQ